MIRKIRFGLVVCIPLALIVIAAGVYPVFASPPMNDDIETATGIGELPYTDYLDTSEATPGANDPWSYCHYEVQQATVWYSYTPSVYMQLKASTSGSDYATVTSVYKYDDYWGDLSIVTCTTGPNDLTFYASSGETYYIMVGAEASSEYYGEPYPPPGGGYGGYLVFTLEEMPLPLPDVYFWFNPYDPSIFDTVQFYNNSWDPAYAEMSAYWDFGDGTNSTDWSPYHRYEYDGSYMVTLTVTTEDGRSNTNTQEVLVSTHDVGIKKFTVPTAAKVGQTRHLQVGISNIRQPEYVEVQLYKSTNDPWSNWVYFGSLIQYVPVRPANRTTTFDFTYTFTIEDGEIGKLNFRAEAYIQGARDALFGDNTAVSLPVKVAP